MSEEEREAARLLEPLRHFQPPVPAGVDVKQAVRSGKRTVLVRQVAGTVACLVAVIGVAVTLNLPREQPPAAPTGDFGATTQEFGIGSAAGFTPLTYETGVDRQRAVLTAPGLDAEAVVTMYGNGISPLPDGKKWTPSGEEGPEVNGNASLWLDEPVIGDNGLELAWKWKPGAWAFVRLTGSDADRDRAHKVAQSIEPGAQIPVSSAVELPADLVPGAQLTGTVRSIGELDRPELVNETRYTVGGDPDAWIAVGVRQPDLEAANSVVGDRDAFVEDHKITFLDGTGLFVEVSEDLDLDVPLTELAAEIVVDPDFAWSPTPSISPSSEAPSSEASPTTSEPESSSPSDSDSASQPTSETTS